MSIRVPGFAFLAVLLFSSRASVAQTFTSSNLPIIIIDTQGQPIPDDPKITAHMGIIDNGPGVRNNVTDSASNYDGPIGIEVRGSSSQMFPKKQYGIEVRDANGDGIDKSLLGMPKKDDWVLFAPYNDKSLIRDAMAYKLGRDQGRYASRSRFCEVVLNGEYQGVYVLLEKIKRDKNRVDIAKLDPGEISGDDLTGGYIIKIDKTTGSGGDGWWSPHSPHDATNGQGIYFLYDYPKPTDIAFEQKGYIQGAIAQFENALIGPDFKDPTGGYAGYIDVDSFVDFFIMSEITKNVDAYRLSTYLYKQKDSDGGKLFMGPIWDFNLGFGNADYCTQGNPEGFVIYFNKVCPQDWWQIPFWWDRLLEDDAFKAKLSARWTSLRSGKFQTNTLLAYVDSVTTALNESQQRNFQAWPVLGQYVWPNYYVGQTYNDEVNWLKSWITDRVAWLDENIPTVVTGVQERGLSFSIQSYPNPFSNDFQIEYQLNRPGLLSVEIVDVFGRKVDHREAKHEKEGRYLMSVNAVNFSTGTYIIKARFGDQVETLKVIKRP